MKIPFKPLGLAVGLAVLVTGGLGALIRSQRRSAWGPPPPSAAAQADAVIRRWTDQKVPEDKRSVIVVLYDQAASGQPLDPPEGGEAKANPLNLLLGKQPAPETISFVRAMADQPDVVLIPFDPAAKDKAEATEAVKQTVVKAHDAGAEINMVTQGAAVAPAIKALSALDGVQRQGVPVGVNKLVSLGVQRPRLRKLDPFFAADPRPKNVLEWANFYKEPGSVPPRAFLELSARGAPPTLFPAGGLALALAADPARVTQQVLSDTRPISSAAKAARAADAPAELEERMFRSLDGQMTKRVFRAANAVAPGAPPSAQSDSFAMIQQAAPDTEKVTAGPTCPENFHFLEIDAKWCCPNRPGKLNESRSGSSAERYCCAKTSCVPIGKNPRAKGCQHAFWVETNGQWWCCSSDSKIEAFHRCYEQTIKEARVAMGCRPLVPTTAPKK